MKKDITLKVEIFSSEADDKHRIASPKEIEFVLNNIVKNRERVALYYDDANEFVMTSLLGVDKNGLWLEQSPDGAINQKIAAASKLVVVSSHHNVKVQFTCGKPSVTLYQNLAAFALPLPDSLYRLQRREYFRLMTPALNTLKCAIPSPRLPKPQVREVTIMDISGSGIALTCSEDDADLVPGESYQGCRINIPDYGTITGTIMVRNIAVLTNAAGHSYKRAGCELQNLDNASGILLQRYVLHLQRTK